jgi:hypothetical protein
VEEENMTKTLLAVLAHPDDESFGLAVRWLCTPAKVMMCIMFAPRAEKQVQWMRSI